MLSRFSELFKPKKKSKEIVEVEKHIHDADQKYIVKELKKSILDLFEGTLTSDNLGFIQHTITTNLTKLEEYSKSDKGSWVHAFIQAKDDPFWYFIRIETENEMNGKKIDWVYHLTFDGKPFNRTLLSKFVMNLDYEMVIKIIEWSEKYLKPVYHPDDMMDYYHVALVALETAKDDKDSDKSNIQDALQEVLQKKSIEFTKKRTQIVDDGLRLFPNVLTKVVIEYLDDHNNKQVKKNII